MKTHYKCRICNGEDLVDILDLGYQVLSGVFPKQDEKDPTNLHYS